MPDIVEPLEAFRHLTATEISVALRSYENNPIAREVARLVQGYSRNFAAHVARLGHIPPDIFLHVKPETAIEAVAIRLTVESIQQRTASQ